MTAMSRYLAGVLSVIAAGIILIAYGLLSPQVSAYNAYSNPSLAQAAPAPAHIVRVADTASVQPRVVTRTVVREPKRDWGKTAMVIGGSSAAGAGIGGIVGGKKGALIGAAIGGGASTLYESRH